VHRHLNPFSGTRTGMSGARDSAQTSGTGYTVRWSKLLHNYIVMVLIALLNSGLVDVLSKLSVSTDRMFSRMATTLMTELLELSSLLLPKSVSVNLNSLPDAIATAVSIHTGNDVECMKCVCVSVVNSSCIIYACNHSYCHTHIHTHYRGQRALRCPRQPQHLFFLSRHALPGRPPEALLLPPHTRTRAR
jgi:hypothetical protein